MNKISNLTTGELIAFKRKEKGYTQIEFANLIGVSNKTVSKWETGAGMPDISLILPISKALDLSADELLKGKPSYINILKSNLALFYKNKNSDFNSVKKEIICFNIINFLLILFLFIICYYFTINMDYISSVIHNVGVKIDLFCNIIIFIVFIFIVYFLILSQAKNLNYIYSIVHFIFSISSILSYTNILKNLDLSIDFNHTFEFYFKEYLLYYFIGLFITIILYQIKPKKTEN